MMRQTVFTEQKILKGSRWLLLKNPANLAAAQRTQAAANLKSWRFMW
jgi:hypothetical protein